MRRSSWKSLRSGARSSSSRRKDKTPESVIRAYIRKKMQWGWENPNAARVFSNEVAAGAPFLGKHWPDALKLSKDTARTIQSWVDSGQIRQVDPLLARQT